MAEETKVNGITIFGKSIRVKKIIYKILATEVKENT